MQESKENLVSRIVDYEARISHIQQQANEIVGKVDEMVTQRAKDAASLVLVGQLFPIVNTVLKEDFGFTDDQIAKFNEMYSTKSKDALTGLEDKFVELAKQQGSEGAVTQ
jgi:hypothetical protein